MQSPVFISGPMTGYPEWNFPAFYAAEGKLAISGHKVINPAREFDGIPPEEVGSWSECMRIAMRHLTDARSLVVLSGWQESRGAKLEVLNAKNFGMRIYDFETLTDITDEIHSYDVVIHYP